jgi:hypothetical protein
VNTNVLSPPEFLDEPLGNGALNGIPVTVAASVGPSLAGVVYAFSIIAASSKPRMWPCRNAGRGTSDALNRRYPTLYETGGAVATVELEVPNNAKDQPAWRLVKELPGPRWG